MSYPIISKKIQTPMILWALTLIFATGTASGALASLLPSTREKLLANASHLLDEANVSYAYGGSQFGYGQWCELCNACIRQVKPSAKQQLAKCPICRQCSLDCTHFIHMVFNRSGIKFPYLTSALMADLPPEKLQKLYGFYDVGSDVDAALGGDILVYEGHAVILEKNRHNGRGDIIHVTSGKDIRIAGQAIQRERFAYLAGFRGTLRRILRHRLLDEQPPVPTDEMSIDGQDKTCEESGKTIRYDEKAAPVKKSARFRPVR